MNKVIAVAAILGCLSSAANADGFSAPPTKFCINGSVIFPVPDYFLLGNCQPIAPGNSGRAACLHANGQLQEAAAPGQPPPYDGAGPNDYGCGWH
jgi:hypothetical protein